MIPAAILDQLAAAGWAVLSATRTETSGRKSDTFLVRHRDGSSILKIYNGRGGTPAAKCAREWLGLGALSGQRGIPRRRSRDPDGWLLMECLPGRTLRSCWDGLDPDARGKLCVE